MGLEAGDVVFVQSAVDEEVKCSAENDWEFRGCVVVDGIGHIARRDFFRKRSRRAERFFCHGSRYISFLHSNSLISRSPANVSRKVMIFPEPSTPLPPLSKHRGPIIFVAGRRTNNICCRIIDAHSSR